MDKKAQRLLAREIDNMELMHHPNIIRLFEVKFLKHFIILFLIFCFIKLIDFIFI